MLGERNPHQPWMRPSGPSGPNPAPGIPGPSPLWPDQGSFSLFHPALGLSRADQRCLGLHLQGPACRGVASLPRPLPPSSNPLLPGLLIGLFRTSAPTPNYLGPLPLLARLFCTPSHLPGTPSLLAMGSLSLPPSLKQTHECGNHIHLVV